MLVEFWIGRKVLRFPLRHAAAHPTDDELELLGRERLVVAEIAEAFYRAPWRHAPFQHFFFDRDSPGARLGVGHQREDPATVVMAGGATLIDDARDLAIPSNRGGDDVVRGRNGGNENQCPTTPHGCMIQRHYVYDTALLPDLVLCSELACGAGRPSGYRPQDRGRDGSAGGGLVESAGAREGRKSRGRARRARHSRGNGCGGCRSGHGVHVAAAGEARGSGGPRL